MVVVSSAVAKSRRFEGRVDAESYEAIARAAVVTGQSKAAFMVAASRAEADRVLGRADVTLMPPEQFDALVASLDEPGPVPEALSRAVRAPHRVVQR
jgi:uncharacterized protein (DUF1778 family)